MHARESENIRAWGGAWMFMTIKCACSISAMIMAILIAHISPILLLPEPKEILIESVVSLPVLAMWAGIWVNIPAPVGPGFARAEPSVKIAMAFFGGHVAKSVTFGCSADFLCFPMEVLLNSVS